MPPLRRFDHDEARRLRAAGVKRKEVAEMMGVSEGAIHWATSPGIKANWRGVHYKIPPDLKRALERCAKSEGRSETAQVIYILKEYLDWHWYEEDEKVEEIFAYPTARYIRRDS